MFTMVIVNFEGKVKIHSGLTLHNALELVKIFLEKDEFGFYLATKKFILFYPNGKKWEKYIN